MMMTLAGDIAPAYYHPAGDDVGVYINLCIHPPHTILHQPEKFQTRTACEKSAANNTIMMMITSVMKLIITVMSMIISVMKIMMMVIPNPYHDRDHHPYHDDH